MMIPMKSYQSRVLLKPFANAMTAIAATFMTHERGRWVERLDLAPEEVQDRWKT